MNFHQLEYVVALHQHRHFQKAADCCHVTQATLSTMVKKLEEELGFMLFDRSKAPVKTTDLGLLFIAHATKALALRNEMESLKEGAIKSLEGTLTIGIIPTVASALLPLILPALLNENPKLKLVIAEITTEEIIQRLTQDKIDMGILSTPLEDEPIDEVVLYYESMKVYGEIAPDRQYITSKDIRDKKIWLLEEGHCFRKQSLTICDMKEYNKGLTNLHFEGSSFETLLHLADTFGGCVLLPELYYNNLSPAQKGRTKSFAKPVPVREISLIMHRPYAKQQTAVFLASRIKTLVADQLSTTKYAATDLEIIGF